MLTAQFNIGWKLCIEGCIHKSWEDIMNNYLISLDAKTTGRRWITALIKKLWDVAWDMWQHRNDALHKEQNNLKLLGHDTTKIEISDEYKKGADALMESDEKALFSQSLQDILQMPFQRQQAWVDKVKAARTLCDIRNEMTMKAERSLMKKFLTNK